MHNLEGSALQNHGLFSRFSCGKCIEQTETDCYWCTEEAVCKPARSSCINVSKYLFKKMYPRY